MAAEHRMLQLMYRHLQRRSKRLNHRTVAAVLEVAAGVFSTESRDGAAHRFEKSSSALGIKPVILLNASSVGLKSGRIGWQIYKLTTLTLNEIPNSLSLVNGEVFHHHLTSTQRGCQDLLHICLKELTVGRAFNDQRWPHPLHAHATGSSVVFLP
jgi:hypothetical protein